MRVFRTFYFDLKKRVLFKDTLPFVETWLEEQGITYEKMAFMLDVSYGDRFDKAVKVLPDLERYRRKHCNGYDLTDEGLLAANGEILPFQYEISSVPQNWPENTIIHVCKEDESLVRKVIQKIPRPINPGFTNIVLDNVHWFPEINITPGVADYDNHNGRVYPNAINLYPYYSNNIVLSKAFDYGIKHNIVSATIEQTKSHEELLDIAPIVEKLTAFFGTPTPIRTGILNIIFDDIEIKANSEAENAFSSILQNLWDELQPHQALLAITKNNPPIFEATKIIMDGQEINHYTQNETENVSIKKSVLKYLKPLGFTYKYAPDFCFLSTRKNKYNYVVEVGFGKLPMSFMLNHWITIQGYNFSVNVPLGINVEVANQQTIDNIVEKTAEIAILAEERLIEPLYEYFGKTPQWY